MVNTEWDVVWGVCILSPGKPVQTKRGQDLVCQAYIYWCTLGSLIQVFSFHWEGDGTVAG